MEICGQFVFYNNKPQQLQANGIIVEIKINNLTQ